MTHIFHGYFTGIVAIYDCHSACEVTVKDMGKSTSAKPQWNKLNLC